MCNTNKQCHDNVYIITTLKNPQNLCHPLFQASKNFIMDSKPFASINLLIARNCFASFSLMIPSPFS